MPKSLGQIHSVNATVNPTSPNDKFQLDLSGQLTEQLQRMVRCGTYHKCVGIDMSIQSFSGPATGGQISGRIKYFAPTRGRCAAIRGAFKATADAMKVQGISMRDNPLYDFKLPLDNGIYLNNFKNGATLDGIIGLAMTSTIPNASVFGVHNTSVRPTYTGSPSDLYSEGFNTLLQGGGGVGTDFVLNDTIPFSGDPDFASEEFESIPFMLAWDPGSSNVTTQFQWRPDPALFLAILGGQLVFEFDSVELDGGGSAVTVVINVMVSGWKSIMGNPDKKRRSSKKSSSKKTMSKGRVFYAD